MATPEQENSLQEIYRTFISGCHILHYHGVLDAYGHLSVRHPSKPDIFIMSLYIAPANIASPDDLIEYYVSNAEPVHQGVAKGYSERCIHSECYKRYPSVHSVIHSHSEAVVPYSLSGVALRPCIHMAGFLSANVPIFEIADVYRDGEEHDLLVSNTHLGGELAAKFAETKDVELPEHPVVLMRGHGFTVAGSSIQDAVVRAIYTQKNAVIQTTALTTAAAGGASPKSIRYLSDSEIAATAKITKWSAYRPWGLWMREVEAAELYVNSA